MRNGERVYDPKKLFVVSLFYPYTIYLLYKNMKEEE